MGRDLRVEQAGTLVAVARRGGVLRAIELAELLVVNRIHVEHSEPGWEALDLCATMGQAQVEVLAWKRRMSRRAL